MGELRNEYAQTGNREVLHAIMRIYKEEYMPEVLNLRQLDHEVMEMVSVDNRFKLFQRDTKMSSLDYLFGKPPAVKTFQV
jgi:proteasome lid subunit RPN8/RPN11